jgi:hypothetical protein
MAAEFYISFRDPGWYSSNLQTVEAKICELKTFIMREGSEFRLLGHEDRDQDDRWSYDVRLFTRDSDRIMMEISAHPESIEKDLLLFLSWLRSGTDISVIDEDGVPSGW